MFFIKVEPVTTAMAASGDALFRPSLTARRFPALANLTSDDVEVMVMKQPSAGDSTGRSIASGSGALFDREIVKPSVVGTLSAPSKATPGRGGAHAASASDTINEQEPSKRPPFMPCNPSQARDKITLEKTGYVAMYSPYDSAHRQQVEELEQSARMRVGGNFVPPSSTKARDLVAVNYYLNSPDAETIEAERHFIKERAARNSAELRRQPYGRPRGSTASE